MLAILLIALSTLASEDLTCIATGALIAQRQLGALPGIFACTLGIFAGDLALVVAGRYAKLLRIRTPACLDVLKHRASHVLLWSRFTPGLRLPTYLGAGLLRLPMRTVIPPLLAGSLLWTPLLVGLAALFGSAFVTSGLTALQFAAAAAVLWRTLSSYERRRRVLAFLNRLFRWEFWPVWAAYLPLVPWFLWLALKHRSFTLFMAANPGIPTGGLVGESKSAILKELSREPEFAARFDVIPPGGAGVDRVRVFLDEHGLSYPVVLKPDVGERGAGVSIARSEDGARAYLATAPRPVIVQEYIAGEEFGVFYRRMPWEPGGRVTSITWKRLPSVTGDGRSTVERLILADPRAFVLNRAYLRGLRVPPSYVAAQGECVPLVEIGSHCRGAIFLNASSSVTPALETAIDRAAKAHPGFFFGRFDVRADSLESLQAGRFKVLELNGVGAEATHIYDPSVSLREAYRTLMNHWSTAFEIGAANREGREGAPLRRAPIPATGSGAAPELQQSK